MILQKKLHKIRKEPSEIETEIKNVESISRGSFVKEKGLSRPKITVFLLYFTDKRIYNNIIAI